VALQVQQAFRLDTAHFGLFQRVKRITAAQEILVGVVCGVGVDVGPFIPQAAIGLHAFVFHQESPIPI
jgi:L-alanine-DL-glutamate epimerase-like enolase superfamily enzyme